MKRTLDRFGFIVAAMAVATSATLSARGDYLTFEIASHEAMADYTRFESRSWAADAVGEGGRLERNTVWSGDEHVIVSDIYIPSGVTLTINAGTIVKFREGTRIKVEDGGSLVINGASGNEVVLEGYDDETVFTGIVLQSSAASYSDNSFVIVRGFNFGRYATVSLNNTTAFLGGGQALVPVDVSGSRDTAFSFDWVAETNGVTFASGTMNWNRVSDGRKNITVPYPDGLPGCSNFVIRAVTFRCCSPNVRECVVTLSEFVTTDIFSHEAMADSIAFESREWAAGMEGEGGRLATNATWSGKHTIVSDVYIPSGVTLTLTADTVVEFCEGTRIKIEDGGTLNIVGADGHDVILRGAEGVANFGGIVKMPNGTFIDNSYFRFEGFTYGALANVALHDSSTFRSSGLALIPVTVSGSRSTAFSIDWVAETNGAPYKTGTLKWNNVSEGTKNISINYGAELDGYTNFTLRATVDRACKTSPNTCTIKISDFIVSDIASHESMADSIRFETRDWAADLEGEGGRLAANATWEGTHKIASDVYIPSGVTLTLAADAVVEFYEGTRIKIEDGGTLNIVGANGHDVILRGAEGVTNYVGIVKMPNGTYTDNMYVQYTDKPYSAYPYITVHEATTYREAGKMWIAFSLSGTTRNQSFNVDWSTDKGDSGTLTWSSSSDGTKWIQIPIDTELVGGTTNHVINVTAARGCNISVGRATLTVLEPDYVVKGQVALAESEFDSGDFAVNGDIKTQPLFLNDTETVQYSGKWQPYDENEAAVLRVTLETDNGATVLKEASPSETGAFDLDLKQYPVGYYTLKHEILNDLGETLATMQKTFSIADDEDVVLHGGVLTSNEVWAADKVHVFYETVVVPSIYTIFIEPGAIVKFMTGTGIDISQGGAFFANRIVFAHINDDTVGGDTLSDGFTVAPPMDAYFLSGAFTFGDDTELRGITQNNALTGTIATQKTLSRGSTYRVSGTLTIASGGSLTIPPGTVLKMEDKAAIVVNSGATLNAVGTRAAPITFTSIKDDTISGDTNGDGGNTIPQPGDWEEIKNNGGTMNLANVTALYGGYGQYSNQGDAIIRTANGATTMDSCVVKHSNLRLIGRTGGTVYAVNCILEDGRWGIDGAVTFVNGVIANCNTGANGATLKNSILWECDTYASGGTASDCVAYGETTAVQAGMTYADPLFVDPVNGDFRVKEGSPCVDAADGAVAPELDFYGQPRITITDHGDELVGQLADIGICEVMPRYVASDIDLVPQSVRTTTNAVPGQLLFVKWEITNIGGCEVDAAWRDTVSLVSKSGREVVLGDKTTSSRIGVGGSVFCSGYFTVPAIAEGTWYPKVNVNSYHDIFEGSLAANNARTGERAVSVGLETLDPSISREGVINGGTPTVLKLAYGEDAENRMVKLDVPAGVRVTYGFGFLPQGASRSGAATASGAGVMFRVPDGATDVYVVLESDATASYALSTESTKLAIAGVSPATLPSSGTTTLTITGAGFGDESVVTLSGAGGSYRVPSTAKDASGALVATVDCAALAAGQTYDVKVASGAGQATLARAVSVAAVKGEGKFWARLVVPGSVREGRKVSCAIEYGNSGNADLPAQVLQVKVENNGSLLYPGNPKTFTDIHFIAATTANGTIAAGDADRIPFVLLAGSNSRLRLHAGGVEDGVAVSAAAATVFARESDRNDYRLVANELSEESAIGSNTFVEYRKCYPDTGNEVSLRVTAEDWDEEVVLFSAKSIETLESYDPVSLEGGIAEFAGLPTGGYRIFAESDSFIGTTFATVGNSCESISLTMKRKVNVTGTVESPSEDDIAVFIGEDNTYYAMVGAEGEFSVSLPAGVYDAALMSPSGSEYTPIEDLEIVSDASVGFSRRRSLSSNAAPATRGVPTITDYNDHFYENKYTQAQKRYAEGVRLLFLAASAYDKPFGEYDCPHNWEIYRENYRRVELFRIKLETFNKNARMADPYKALAMLGKSVHDTARAYLDYWMASKAKFATARYGEWAGGLFNAKKTIAAYVYVQGLDAIESTIGTFETKVESLQYLVEHRELSVRYVTQVLDHIAAIKKGAAGIKGDLDVLVATGALSLSDVELLEQNLFGDMLDYINAAATIAELVSDWLKTGESGGEWLAGRIHIDDWISDFEAVMRDFAAWLPPRPYLMHCCDMKEGEDISDVDPVEMVRPSVPRSCDPNEMAGEPGVGDPGTERFVKPGQELTYTIYFENQTNATAAAQEVYVSETLSANLDWSTFEMCEVAFGDQIDLGLAGRKNGSSDAAMDGTNLLVRTSLALDETTGLATWYLRIVDPTTDTGWPADILAGFLPPNDPETHCGEGHLTYRVKVRKDAVPGARIDASATIVFDYNDPIETDPAWWNTVGGDPVRVTFDARGNARPGTTAENTPTNGVYYALPDAPEREGYGFVGWALPDGTILESLSQLPAGTKSASLHAVWAAEYAVAFDANGGAGQMDALRMSGDVPATLPSCAFSKAGGAFVGWATRPDGEVRYLDGSTVAGLTTVPGATVTLYAVWADAATTTLVRDGDDLQSAIDATPDGGLVLVYPGAYAPIDATDRALAIRAVFGPDSDAPDAAPAVIDGGGAARCATLGEATVLSGFVLRNGAADFGGGAMGGILEDCVIENCAAVAVEVEPGVLAGGDGGGAYGSALTRCTIVACTADGNGGGLFEGSAENTVVENCDAALFGGGAFHTTLTGCTVYGNAAETGAGVAGCTVRNSIVWENRIYAVDKKGVRKLGNCANVTEGKKTLFKTTCTYTDSSPKPAGTGNLAKAPLFVDAANGDFRLQWTSPVKNKGRAALSLGDRDLGGLPRLIGAPDMGAHEVPDGTPVPADYDGDGIADSAYFDAPTATWIVMQSRDGLRVETFGDAKATPVPADYDGDGTVDFATYSATAKAPAFRIRMQLGSEPEPVALGLKGATPLAADLDGDGKADPCVFQSNAKKPSFAAALSGGGTLSRVFGTKGAKAVAGDFDGDRLADIGCYTASASKPAFAMLLSTNGWNTLKPLGITLGAKGSTPCCGDFDGDGTTDFAAYAGSAKTPILYRMLSTSRWREVRSLPFGAKGSRAATGDWDGDGVADPAIETRGAWWFVTRDWETEMISSP